MGPCTSSSEKMKKRPSKDYNPKEAEQKTQNVQKDGGQQIRPISKMKYGTSKKDYQVNVYEPEYKLEPKITLTDSLVMTKNGTVNQTQNQRRQQEYKQPQQNQNHFQQIHPQQQTISPASHYTIEQSTVNVITENKISSHKTIQQSGVMIDLGKVSTCKKICEKQVQEDLYSDTDVVKIGKNQQNQFGEI